jgi:hypothetical protein
LGFLQYKRRDKSLELAWIRSSLVVRLGSGLQEKGNRRDQIRREKLADRDRT